MVVSITFLIIFAVFDVSVDTAVFVTTLMVHHSYTGLILQYRNSKQNDISVHSWQFTSLYTDYLTQILRNFYTKISDK